MRIDPSAYNELTSSIIGAAIDVHRTLGPGLMESVYTPCLIYELTVRKLRFVTQRTLPIVYKSLTLEACYRLDLIVEDKIIVEVKAVAALSPLHDAQVLTYMALAKCPIGLVINFNVARLVDGVRRLINARADG